jgi:TetR/AcrR family transcriptional regulator
MEIDGVPRKTKKSTRKRFSSQERRNQLLGIAVKLFSQRGFEGTTTKSIAAAAGVSEAVIFQHFKNKEDLYASIFDYKATQTGFKEWEERLRGCAEQLDDEKLIFLMVERILQGNREDPQIQRLMFQSVLSGRPLPRAWRQRILPLHRFLCNYIALRQKQGAFKRCDPEVAVHAILSLPSYYGVTKSMFGVDEIKMSERNMASSFTRFILDGLEIRDNASRKKGRKNAKVASAKS